MTVFGKCEPVWTETPMTHRSIMKACNKVKNRMPTDQYELENIKAKITVVTLICPLCRHMSLMCNPDKPKLTSLITRVLYIIISLVLLNVSIILLHPFNMKCIGIPLIIIIITS